jgi:arginine decarboxylase
MGPPAVTREDRRGLGALPARGGRVDRQPDPYGTGADIEATAEICHDHDKPLIVDEAWGAHLPLCEELPTCAMDAGADICVVSVHKMGAGFEQSSMFHLQGNRIDFPRRSACADLLMTTSPNVLRYAAIDGWRRQMLDRGSGLLQSALELTHRLRSAIDRFPEMHVLEDELLGAEASSDLDRLQTMIDLSDLGISGYQAADWLREHERIDAPQRPARTVATVSVADNDSTAERLLQAPKRLSDAAEDFPDAKPIKIPDPPRPRT